MNRDDFRYMWRGKVIGRLNADESYLLEPIHHQTKGHQRALLLLHGFSSSPAVFRAMLPALSNYDTILGPTLPGHGENISSFSNTLAKDWFEASRKAFEMLQKDHQEVDVLGLSLGGLLACHLSLNYAVHHLYLLAPALALTFNIPLALKGAHCLQYLGISNIRNRAGNLRSKQFGELAYRKLPLKTIIEILTLIQSYQFAPPNCPTDLFLGRFDDVVDTKKVAKAFQHAPHCLLHWLDHSAHVLPLDNDVDKICRVLL